jgi:outer membrane protein assembly factor BamD
MFRRNLLRHLLVGLVGLVMMLGTGCRHSKVTNPMANLDSKQPDKVLFDRAIDAMKHSRFEVARSLFQTMINSYPDSEYVARAKLGVGDAWFEEGGSAGMAQAEVEYKDFITFFPNLPEAAEAQLKVAGIHYKQMEKADRDYTHAKRAEDEYRQLIQQFPDSKLLPEAKQRLRNIQEVLADREYSIGRFYYLRESYPAAIARLKSLVEAYPLYSGADEALFLLGQSYEGEMEFVHRNPAPEAVKGKLIEELTNKAAEAYDQIVTRYPAMDKADFAKKRLEALHRPVPQATPEAIALNKKEEESRSETGRMGKIMGNFKKNPDYAKAATVGEPSLTDPKQTSATDVVKDVTRVITSAQANTKTSVETVKGTGEPAANEASPAEKAKAADQAQTPPATVNDADKPATPPPAVNDANAAGQDSAKASSSSGSDSKNDSSSKKKKKKKKKEEEQPKTN